MLQAHAFLMQELQAWKPDSIVTAPDVQASLGFATFCGRLIAHWLHPHP